MLERVHEKKKGGSSSIQTGAPMALYMCRLIWAH
jgi:hypothetical protein